MSARLPRALLALLFCLPVLSACAKVATASVNVLGVNYTEQEFSYRLEDPTNSKNKASGELIDSFSAGGIQCCFELPRVWRPGIKVRILTTQWNLPPPPNDDLKNLKEIHGAVEAEVRGYVEGTPGDLWVVRGADGAFEVISSKYQPDHPKWPGVVKGWPVPSLEYRRKLWSQGYNEAKDALASAREEDIRLANEPEALFLSYWNFGREHRPSEIAGFSGYKDSRYQAKIRADVRNALDVGRDRLKRMEETRP